MVRPVQTASAAVPTVSAAARGPLRAAVLSDRPAATMASLGRLGIDAFDATGTDLALLARDCPDILILDLDPATLGARRAALLVAQLRWARPDMAIAVASGRTAIAQGFAYDLLFDATAPDATLDATFCDLPHLLTHSRLRPHGGGGTMPTLLRRAAVVRRANLFR